MRGGQVISPDNVEIDGRFYIEANNYPSWAKITIVMDIRTKGNYPEEVSRMRLQSTVAGRGH